MSCARGRRAARSRSAHTCPTPLSIARTAPTPEHEALLADSVGLALLVVLETLTPAERLAFVLHDMFSVPFNEIARMLERSPEAVRQLASRARGRVSGAAPPPDADLERQREVIDAFLVAARSGDFDALVAVLDPHVVLRSDAGAISSRSREVHGAEAVASRALAFSRLDLHHQPALINGAAGLVATRAGKPFSVMACTVRGGKIAEVDILADPERLDALDLTVLER
jgi:ketosteroid isomerase-like protein